MLSWAAKKMAELLAVAGPASPSSLEKSRVLLLLGMLLCTDCSRALRCTKEV